MKQSDILKLTLIPIVVWVVCGLVVATLGINWPAEKFTLLEGYTAAAAALGMVALVLNHKDEKGAYYR